MLHKLSFLFLFLASFSYGFINVAPPIIGTKTGLSAEMAVGANHSAGNSDSASVALGFKGQYDDEKWLLYLLSSYTYGESNNLKDSNEGLFHLRYIHTIEDTDYDYEFFIQSEFNEFQKIKDRNLLGANIRKSFSLGFDSLYLGLGAFYSYTEPEKILSFDPIYKQTNMNSYLSFVKKIDTHFSVTYLGFYQPNIEDFSDFKTFQVLQLSTSITDNTTLSLDLNHRYSSNPYLGIEKSDFRSMINLRYELK